MAVTFPDMYDYNDATGMTVPITSDIKEYVQNSFKDIFGDDMDLSDETPAGRLVEALTLMFKNAVGVNAQNLNQINIQYATGQYLDSMARFFGLERLSATKTSFQLVAGADEVTTIPEGTVLTDPNGNTYVVKQDITVDDDTAHADYPDVEYVGFGLCEATEYGPIFPPKATGSDPYMFRIADLSGATNVSFARPDTYGMTMGRNEETDAELRTRISTARNFNSGCTQAIANAIWKVAPDLRSVRVIENSSSSTATVAGITMRPHSILVAVAGTIPDIYDIRSNIGRAIYMTKPAGIDFTDSSNLPSDKYGNNDTLQPDANSGAAGNTSGYVNYNPTHQPDTYDLFICKYCIPATDESSGLQYPMIFYRAAQVSLDFNITVRVNGYPGTDIIDDVQKVVRQYVSSKIDKLTSTELMMVISQAITGVFITSFEMWKWDSQHTQVTEVTPNALEHLEAFLVNVTVQNM